jgi:hypoxanthine phosphoribosyltransferase
MMKNAVTNCVQKNKTPRLGQVLISKDQIARRITQLAEEIRTHYDGRENSELVIVAIMTGSLVFLADLIRQLPLPIRLALMIVSNYPGTATQARGVQIRYDIQENIANKDVLVVDDIFDTGQTLSAVIDLLKERAARSVRTCVLLKKLTAGHENIEPDFVGFEIPDKFVVGYGLDYNNLFRNCPEIAVLDQ